LHWQLSQQAVGFTPDIGFTHTIRSVREISSGYGSGEILATNTIEQQIAILGHDTTQQVVLFFPETR